VTPEHLTELGTAKRLLEHPGLAIKLANLLGGPIEKGFELLPANWSRSIGRATTDALTAALKGAVLTMDASQTEASPWWHKAAAVASGAAGGFFGLPALVVELPVSTTIMCRSIADIARSHGESLADPETQMACVEVFALGGPSKSDDAADAGYFATRAALAKAVSDAVQYLGSHAVAEQSAPALVRLVALVASRFQLQVTEKVAAQAVPIIGAAAGAFVNLLFIDHFQDMSRGHFTVRRLERLYDPETVREEYTRLT